MSSSSEQLLDEIVSHLRSAGLSDGNAKVRRVFDSEQEDEPGIADLPTVWVDDLRGGGQGMLTTDTARGSVDLAVWCWVAATGPGKDARRRANRLLSYVKRSIGNKADLGAALGVMPGSYSWGGEEFYQGERATLQMAVLTLPINCGIDVV